MGRNHPRHWWRVLRTRGGQLLVTVATATVMLAPAPSLSLPVGGFVFPLMSPRKSSGFGDRTHPVLKVKRHHGGIDLAAPSGALIRAIKGGTVIFADPHGGYGNLIVIKHANGYTSHYGHCEQIKVLPGASVKAGQIIGTVGATGRVTGPHLHFELRKDGKTLNPDEYLPALSAPGAG